MMIPSQNHPILGVDPHKCNGCMKCEEACASVKIGLPDRSHSRIRVYTLGDDTFLPITCQQCEDAPCLTACPKDAISRDEETNIVFTDYNRCVGCRMCLFACPFGAMGFDEARGLTFKCDLCGGEPACVPACEPNALMYAACEALQTSRRRHAALYFTGRRSLADVIL